MTEFEIAKPENPEAEVFMGTVVYEDTATRDRAIQLCRSLEQGLQPDIQSQFSWWKFDYLRDEILAKAAVESAVESGMILFSAHAGRELPKPVEDWIETWAQHKKSRNGLLVALIGLPTDRQKGLTPIHNYLREIAQHTRMDFLSHVAGSGGESDFSLDALLHRADTMTSFMNKILETGEQR